VTSGQICVLNSVGGVSNGRGAQFVGGMCLGRECAMERELARCARSTKMMSRWRNKKLQVYKMMYNF
jgi:hypothetical protein